MTTSFKEHARKPRTTHRVHSVKQLHTIEEAVKILSLSKAHLYREIRAGRLETVKSGRATRITARAIAKFVELLEKEARVAQR